MRIILLKDIKNLGRKGDIKEVTEGFALNYLVPQNLAGIYNTMAANKIPAKSSSNKKRKKKK